MRNKIEAMATAFHAEVTTGTTCYTSAKRRNTTILQFQASKHMNAGHPELAT